jgi:hypothetical protein
VVPAKASDTTVGAFTSTAIVCSSPPNAGSFNRQVWQEPMFRTGVEKCVISAVASGLA